MYSRLCIIYTTNSLSGIASVPQVLEDIASILDPTPKEITMETVGEGISTCKNCAHN